MMAERGLPLQHGAVGCARYWTDGFALSMKRITRKGIALETRRPDRRIQRTREALRDALLSLLPEVGWDEIDVAMLCARANIGRSTFYLHYTDKAALLRGAFGDLHQHVLASVDPARKGNQPFPFLPALLAHVHEHQDVFRSLLGRRSSQAVQDHMRDMLISLFMHQDALSAAKLDAPSSPRPHLLAGSLMQLMVWWLGSEWQLTPEEVAGRFLSFSVSPPG